jgi:hypothetical protein
VLGEEAKIFKARYLYGKRGRICGGHKRESVCALPGEVCLAAECSATAAVRAQEGQAEVSRRHSRSEFDRTEGPNML